MEAMSDQLILDNLRALHAEEEKLRLKALGLVARDSQLQLHISVIENAINLADLFRQFPTDDEDMKAIQLLGMRAFNAFGSSLKLALSGYGQNSALIMRLILEIVFLLELLEGDRSLIERWRCADEKERKEKFWPAPGTQCSRRPVRIQGEKARAALQVIFRICWASHHEVRGHDATSTGRRCSRHAFR